MIDRLHHADLVARRVDLVALALAGQLKLLQCDDAFERRRFALQNENVAWLDHHIAGRLVAAAAASQQRDDLDLALAELFQRLHRDAGGGRVFGHRNFGRVALQIEGGVHRG